MMTKKQIAYRGVLCLFLAACVLLPAQYVSGYDINGDETFENQTLNFNENLVMGNNPGDTGNLTMINSTVSSTGHVIVGRAGTGILTMTGGSLHSTNHFLIADFGTANGSFTLNSGRVTTNANFCVGKDGGTGALTIKDGTVEVKNGNFYAGFTGNGTVVQTGGTVDVASIYFADNNTTTGTYTMSDNSLLKISNMFSVGQWGRGILTVNGGEVDATGRTLYLGGEQAGSSAYGTLNINKTDAGQNSLVKTGDVQVGSYANTLGEFNISDGELRSSGTLYVGNNATGRIENGTFHEGGVVNQTGGTVNTVNLRVAYGANSTGKYTMDGGTINMTGTTSIGHQGGSKGEFILKKGTFNADGQVVYLADDVNSSGSFTMSGSEADSTFKSRMLVIGQRGTGSFIQNGGTLTVAETFGVGATNTDGASQAVGDYQLNGGTATVRSAYIGARGTGTMTIDGGTFNSGSFRIGYADSGERNGTLTMKSGALNVNNSSLWVANSADSKGVVNHSGGTITVTNEVFIGDTTNADGKYYMTGAGAILNAKSLNVGQGTGSTGLFEMSAGKVNLTGTDNIFYVGNQGKGTARVSGGEMNFWRLRVAENAGSGDSVLYLSDTGNIKTTGGAWVGVARKGSVVQTGGTMAINPTSTVTIADSSDAAGSSYSISNGGLSAGNLIVGNSGQGLFTQSGGTVALGGALTVGNNAGAADSSFTKQNGSLSAASLVVGNSVTGAFSQSGGAMTISGDTTIGNNAKGSFTQSGGTVAVGGAMTLGYNFTADDSVYTISGAADAVTLNVSGNLIVGRRGKGTFNQEGGTVNVGVTAANRLYIGNGDTGATGDTTQYPIGVYNLSGGVLNAKTIRIYLGNRSDGTLNITGGTANLEGISMAPNTAANSGGALAHATLILDNGGTLNIGLIGVVKNGDATIQLGTGTIGALAGHTWSVAATLTGNTTFDTTGGDITYAEHLGGTGGLTKIGTGTLTLTNGGNNFQGGITVNGGTLAVSQGAVPGMNDYADSTVTVNQGATLQLNGQDALVWHEDNPAMIYVNEGTVTTDGSNSHHSIGNFTLTSGTVTATGPLSTDGRKYLLDGTFYVKANTAGNSVISAEEIHLRTSGVFDIDEGGVLDISSRIGAANLDTLTQRGKGTLILSNTLKVNVASNDGTLLIGTNSLGGSLPTSGSGWLRKSAGQLDLVNSEVGTNKFFISGDYTQGSTAELYLEIVKNGVGSYEYDSLNVGGNITLDGTLNILLTGQDWTPEDYGWWTEHQDTFQIFNKGVFSGDFAEIIWTGVMDQDLNWYFNADRGTLELRVPEPTTCVMLLLGLLAVASVRTRRFFGKK